MGKTIWVKTLKVIGYVSLSGAILSLITVLDHLHPTNTTYGIAIALINGVLVTIEEALQAKEKAAATAAGIVLPDAITASTTRSVDTITASVGSPTD